MAATTSRGTYTVDVSCSNCGWHGQQTIPKGEKAPGRRLQHAPSADECPNCGCQTLTAGLDHGARW